MLFQAVPVLRTFWKTTHSHPSMVVCGRSATVRLCQMVNIESKWFKSGSICVVCQVAQVTS